LLRKLVRTLARRPVEIALIVEIDRRYIRAAALHLERPESVPCADFEHSHAGHVLGQAVVLDCRAQIEPSVGPLPRLQFECVVPVALPRVIEQVYGCGLHSERTIAADVGYARQYLNPR